MNAMAAIMPTHAAVADVPMHTVRRIENIRQPVLDILSQEIDQATEEDWQGLMEASLRMHHAARILWLEQHANEAGVVQH